LALSLAYCFHGPPWTLILRLRRFSGSSNRYSQIFLKFVGIVPRRDSLRINLVLENLQICGGSGSDKSQERTDLLRDSSELITLCRAFGIPTTFIYFQKNIYK